MAKIWQKKWKNPSLVQLPFSPFFGWFRAPIPPLLKRRWFAYFFNICRKKTTNHLFSSKFQYMYKIVNSWQNLIVAKIVVLSAIIFCICTYLGVRSLPCCISEPIVNHIEFTKEKSLTNTSWSVLQGWGLSHSYGLNL